MTSSYANVTDGPVPDLGSIPSCASSTTKASSKYVPPHLRNKPASDARAAPARTLRQSPLQPVAAGDTKTSVEVGAETKVETVRPETAATADSGAPATTTTATATAVGRGVPSVASDRKNVPPPVVSKRFERPAEADLRSASVSSSRA